MFKDKLYIRAQKAHKKWIKELKKKRQRQEKNNLKPKQHKTLSQQWKVYYDSLSGNN